MKKIFIALLFSTSTLFAMEWAEYEMLCYKEGTEPSYDEWEYLSTDGATDYGYEDIYVEEIEITSDR